MEDEPPTEENTPEPEEYFGGDMLWLLPGNPRCHLRMNELAEHESQHPLSITALHYQPNPRFSSVEASINARNDEIASASYPSPAKGKQSKGEDDDEGDESDMEDASTCESKELKWNAYLAVNFRKIAGRRFPRLHLGRGEVAADGSGDVDVDIPLTLSRDDGVYRRHAFIDLALASGLSGIGCLGANKRVTVGSSEEEIHNSTFFFSTSHGNDVVAVGDLVLKIVRPHWRPSPFKRYMDHLRQIFNFAGMSTPHLTAIPSQQHYRMQGYVYQEPINAGAQGTVVPGYRTSDGSGVAIKTLLRKDSPTQDVFIELSLLKQLKHRNVIELVDKIDQNWSSRSGSLGLVLSPLCQASFQDLAHDLSLEHRMSLFAQACFGLEYIHSMGIIHRDIKPGNILFNWDGPEKPRAYWADFGHATTSQSSTHCKVGTRPYNAPEITASRRIFEVSSSANLRPYNNKVDIYSFGLTSVALLTRISVQSWLPKEGITTAKQHARVINRVRNDESLPANWKNILEVMIGIEPHSRPSANVLRMFVEKSGYSMPSEPSSSKRSADGPAAPERSSYKLNKITLGTAAAGRNDNTARQGFVIPLGAIQDPWTPPMASAGPTHDRGTKNASTKAAGDADKKSEELSSSISSLSLDGKKEDADQSVSDFKIVPTDLPSPQSFRRSG